MTRIICVTSGKGGVGKTTVVTNLGAALASHFKKRVAIIDCNVTTSHLGLQLGMYFSPITLNDVLRNETSISDALSIHRSGMYVIPASLDLKDLQGIEITNLRSKVRESLNDFDIVLLDSAPSLGKEAVSSLRAADEVLLITNPSIPAITDIIRCKQMIHELSLNPIGLVVNMYRGESFELTKKQIEDLVDLPVISLIPEDKEVLRSVAMRKPIVMYNRHSKASIELMKLAGFIIGESYSPPKTNFFRRLFPNFYNHFL